MVWQQWWRRRLASSSHAGVAEFILPQRAGPRAGARVGEASKPYGVVGGHEGLPADQLARRFRDPTTPHWSSLRKRGGVELLDFLFHAHWCIQGIRLRLSRLASCSSSELEPNPKLANFVELSSSFS
uniref:Uncharacterized protein n=1 Tax=Oryza punctata TaxID=4537 RepID=A0A0E0JQS4_ORYPU